MELSMELAEAIKKMREMASIFIRNLSYSTHLNILPLKSISECLLPL